MSRASCEKHHVKFPWPMTGNRIEEGPRTILSLSCLARLLRVSTPNLRLTRKRSSSGEKGAYTAEMRQAILFLPSHTTRESANREPALMKQEDLIHCWRLNQRQSRGSAQASPAPGDIRIPWVLILPFFHPIGA